MYVSYFKWESSLCLYCMPISIDNTAEKTLIMNILFKPYYRMKYDPPFQKTKGKKKKGLIVYNLVLS